MSYFIDENTKSWIPHPAKIKGVSMKVLRPSEEGKYKESVALVRVEAGSSVPPHIHENEDDNLYILAGRAKMRVADETCVLEKGIQVSVPAGIEHEIFDVTDDLKIYDIFVPGIF